MPKEPYRGRFQVQGADIPGGGGGYSHKWAQKRPGSIKLGASHSTPLPTRTSIIEHATDSGVLTYNCQPQLDVGKARELGRVIYRIVK